MKKLLILVALVFAFAACGEDETGDASVCINQSMDFASCLSCCQAQGFSGASLPVDNSGNTTQCECR
jgi:hypothetical protein